MNSLLISVLTMGILGAFFSYALSVAQKKLKVEEDPRIDEVEAVLPNANCGGCGYPGCRAFAEAVVAGKVEPNGCPVGGNETAAEVSKILGVELVEKEREVAVLMCRGTNEAAKRKAEYRGVDTCYGAALVQQGDKFCTYGCLGLGDCVDACDFDAIHIKEQGIPIIDREKCTGCGQCVIACPRDLLELHPVSKTYFVYCKSHDDPKTSRKNCANSCIACSLCVRGVKEDEIVMDNFLAIVKDHSVVNNEEAMNWAGKCPTKAIGDLKDYDEYKDQF